MGAMRPELVSPPKLSLGDRVAILSLSTAAPAVFPAVHELAMRRLRADFGLEPVEYPTTRRLHAAPWDRAADLMAAFAGPGIAGVPIRPTWRSASVTATTSAKPSCAR